MFLFHVGIHLNIIFLEIFEGESHYALIQNLNIKFLILEQDRTGERPEELLRNCFLAWAAGPFLKSYSGELRFCVGYSIARQHPVHIVDMDTVHPDIAHAGNVRSFTSYLVRGARPIQPWHSRGARQCFCSIVSGA